MVEPLELARVSVRTMEKFSASNDFFELTSAPIRAVTISDSIRRWAQIQPNRAAVVSSNCNTFSFGELQNLIANVRSDLRSAGFGRSARIAVAIPNGPQAALAIVAVACSAVSIPINPRLSPRELEISFAALRPDAPNL